MAHWSVWFVLVVSCCCSLLLSVWFKLLNNSSFRWLRTHLVFLRSCSSHMVGWNPWWTVVFPETLTSALWEGRCLLVKLIFIGVYLLLQTAGECCCRFAETQKYSDWRLAEWEVDFETDHEGRVWEGGTATEQTGTSVAWFSSRDFCCALQFFKIDVTNVWTL